MFYHQTTHHSQFQADLALAKDISPIFRTVYQKTPLKVSFINPLACENGTRCSSHFPKPALFGKVPMFLQKSQDDICLVAHRASHSMADGTRVLYALSSSPSAAPPAAPTAAASTNPPHTPLLTQRISAKYARCVL